MSAKKSSKEEVVPQSPTILPNEMGWRETKAFFKRRESEAKKMVVDAKLPDVLRSAGETFGREFKTMKALVNFVSKKPGKKGGRKKNAPALSEEQKAKIAQLRKAGKSGSEVAREVGCTLGQVYKK